MKVRMFQAFKDEYSDLSNLCMFAKAPPFCWMFEGQQIAIQSL